MLCRLRPTEVSLHSYQLHLKHKRPARIRFVSSLLILLLLLFSFGLMPPVVESSQVLAFLSQVRNEGGVVFAGLAEKAWRGADEKAAEAAYELAWEELHAGPWQSVTLVWRDAFAFSCLSLASCHHRANRPVEALKVLDLGVIMGGSKFHKELDFTINSISSATGIAKDLETPNGVHQGSHPHVVLPNLQDLHLRKKKEGKMLHEDNNMTFY